MSEDTELQKVSALGIVQMDLPERVKRSVVIYKKLRTVPRDVESPVVEKRKATFY